MDIKSLVSELKGVEVEAMETKANEVMHTTNTGFGKELIPTNVLEDPMLDLVPQYSQLLNLLPGNHGNNMPISAKVPVIGEADLFQWNTEWTTGAWSFITPANHWPHTGEITITQGQYITTVSVSKRELNYAPEQLEAIIRERINRAAARTIDAVIINGDTASSWNVNGTYSATACYAQNDNGIRKVGIANTVVNCGALDSADFLSVKNVLDAGYQADLNNLLVIAPVSVYNKALTLSEVITQDKFGPEATIKAGVLAKIFNMDILVARDFPSATASTGKVSATSGDNTTGSFAVVYKPAVQYGFGQPLEISVYDVPGKWKDIVATFEFGFAIANSVAGLWKTVWLGANITL